MTEVINMGLAAEAVDRHDQSPSRVGMGVEAKKMQVTVIGDGDVSKKAWAQYMEIACRVTARCTDEELGIIPADYADQTAADRTEAESTNTAGE